MSLAIGRISSTVVERHRADDRAEDLLADDLHVAGRVGEDRRLDEVAALADPPAADDRLGAGVEARLQVAEHLAELLVGDQRAHLRRRGPCRCRP